MNRLLETPHLDSLIHRMPLTASERQDRLHRLHQGDITVACEALDWGFEDAKRQLHIAAGVTLKGWETL